MILKFEKEKPDDEEIYIFESTGDTGVSLNKWRDVRDFFGTKDSFYSELIYRRVQFNREGECMDKLEKFIDESLGANYRLSVKKLMQNKTMRVADGN